MNLKQVKKNYKSYLKITVKMKIIIKKKEYIYKWKIKFDDIIKEKSLEIIFLRNVFNKLKNIINNYIFISVNFK